MPAKLALMLAANAGAAPLTFTTADSAATPTESSNTAQTSRNKPSCRATVKMFDVSALYQARCRWAASLTDGPERRQHKTTSYQTNIHNLKIVSHNDDSKLEQTFNGLPPCPPIAL